MKFPHKLICIDIETTDSNPDTGSVIQLSAIVVDENFEIMHAREFNEFVRPLDSYRNPKAMEVNKISEETLNTAMSLYEVAELFDSFCDGERFLASWGSYFDAPFLKKQYEKIHRSWPYSYRIFDLKSAAIWEMAKKDKPLTSGVSKFLSALNKKFEGTQHNALDDIKNSVNILKCLK